MADAVRKRATVSLYNGSDHKIDAGDAGVRWSRDRESRIGPDAGYFRAISRRGETTPGPRLGVRRSEGRGKFLGVHHTMWGEGEGDGGPFTNIRGYLEGDERVLVDGSRSPQMHGTGSEDFYEAGWYFNRGSFNAPFNGSTGHEQKALNCEFSCDSAFRLMVADAVPYQSDLRFSIEHGPANDQDATYGSTAFTYGEARRAVRRTDAIDVGNRGSERSHRYRGGGGGHRAEERLRGRLRRRRGQRRRARDQRPGVVRARHQGPQRRGAAACGAPIRRRPIKRSGCS